MRKAINLLITTRLILTFLPFLTSSLSILYQRGIYPPDGFAKQQKYGLSMMVTEDEGLKIYLESVIKQLEGAEAPTVAQSLASC